MEIKNIESFLNYYEKVRNRTCRVIDCVPPDCMDWNYRDGKFSLGDLVRHIAAIERHMYAETVTGRPSKYRGCGKNLADGYEDIMEFFHEMHLQSMDIFKKLSPEDLNSRCLTPMGTEISVWKWLRAMVEHEIHHRGQIYIYLAMLDVATPPLYGMTSEQVIEFATSGVK